MRRLRLLALGFAVCAVAVATITGGALGAAKFLDAGNMDGTAEVPGPGDPNGYGVTELEIDKKKRKVCHFIGHAELEAVTAAHIHRGGKSVAGPIVITLFEDAEGSGRSPIEGCQKGVNRGLLGEILDTPKRFYANIHTTDFPDGAIRGQLRK